MRGLNKKVHIKNILDRFSPLSNEMKTILLYLEKHPQIYRLKFKKNTGMTLNYASNIVANETGFEYTLSRIGLYYTINKVEYVEPRSRDKNGYLPCNIRLKDWSRCLGKGCYLKHKCAAYLACKQKY
jgi:hypothetical protein